VINERLTRVVGRFRAFVPTPLSVQGLLFAGDGGYSEAVSEPSVSRIEVPPGMPDG
jgi:hypothetical protein